tara:strand:+ start:609 stop:803 length:195 start_codon:yes stop_codon:yes gene_type:complete
MNQNIPDVIAIINPAIPKIKNPFNNNKNPATTNVIEELNNSWGFMFIKIYLILNDLIRQQLSNL